MEVPTDTPVGHMRSGPPPSGLVLCLQTGDDVWRWWYISGATAGYREAWCLESDQGGALGMARICNWLETDVEKKNANR